MRKVLALLLSLLMLTPRSASLFPRRLPLPRWKSPSSP